MEIINKDTKYYIYLCITACIIFGSKFLPAIGAITEYGTTIVGIFIGVIFGYCTIGMILPSFMCFIALGFSGWGAVPEVMQAAIGNSTVLYIISILILSAMLEECGLTNKLVNWLVTRKFIKGKPWALSFMFLLAAYVGSLFVNAIPPTFICWALLTELFVSVGFKKGDKWPMIMMFGVLYTACLASFVPSFQIAVTANIGLLAACSGGALIMNPIKYMIWSFTCSAILFALFFVFVKYIVRPDVSLLQNENLVEEDTQPLTNEQKVTITIFALFVLGLLLPSILPAGNIIKVILDTMSSCGWGLLMVLLAIAVRVDGKAVFPFDKLFSKGVIWDVVLQMATVFTLAAIITDERTGVANLVISIVSPLQNAMGELMFLVLLSLIVTILANLLNTVAVCCTFIPILYMLTQGVGFNMFLFVAILNFVGNICFVMPSATPNAAMMYSQREWIPMNW